MRLPWFREHPIGQRLLALIVVVLSTALLTQGLKRQVLERFAVGGPVYRDIREYTELRQELTELTTELHEYRVVLLSMLVPRSPDHILQLRAQRVELVFAVNARFRGQRLRTMPGISAPLIQSAAEKWDAYSRAVEHQLESDNGTTQAELAAFLNGAESLPFKRVAQQVEAAVNTIRSEEQARLEESIQRTTRSQHWLDLLDGLWLMGMAGFLLYSLRSITRAFTREARYGRFEALRADISNALSSEEVLAEALQQCAEALVRHLEVPLARLWLVAPDAKHLEPVATAGPAAEPHGLGHGPWVDSLLDQPDFSLEAMPLIRSHLSREGVLGIAPWARQNGINALAVFPLRLGARSVGMLEVFFPDHLPADVISPLATVSDTLAQGVERWRAEAARAASALRLEAANVELKRSNEELEHFAYIASHDLQEPLRMVASYTQLLARRYRGQLDADADEFIRYAVDGATRMKRLLQDLLEYSRVGSRRKPLKPTACEVVLERVLRNLGHALRDSQGEVTHTPLPTVLGDEVQLEQLFQNLIANGIKFRRAAVPRVHVSAEPCEEGFRFSVKDNGIGIAAEDTKRLFALFRRLHTAAEYPGTGIGLAVCKKIVERHGGRIWVESCVGEGAIFHFTLRDGAGVEAPVTDPGRSTH